MILYLAISLFAWGLAHAVFALFRRQRDRPVGALAAHLLGPVGGVVGVGSAFLFYLGYATHLESTGPNLSDAVRVFGLSSIYCFVIGWYTSVKVLRRECPNNESGTAIWLTGEHRDEGDGFLGTLPDQATRAK